MKFKNIFLIVIVFCVVLPITYSATYTDYFPVKADTFVEQGNPTTNHETETYEQIQYGSGTTKTRTYLVIPITNISSNKVIDNAILTFLKYGGNGGGDGISTFDVYVRNWSEKSITWNNQPCTATMSDSTMCNTTSSDTKITSPGGATITWNVTSIVRSAYNQGFPNVTLVMAQDTGGALQDSYFRSREYSPDPFNNILITYTDLASIPVVNSVSINSTVIKQNYDIQIRFNITGTGKFKFSWNNSGAQANDSEISLSTTIVYINKTVTAVSGSNITYFTWVGDNSGSWNKDTEYSFIVAGENAPTITLNTNNFFNALNNAVISYNRSRAALINLTLNDDIDLYAIEFNITRSNGSLFFNFTNTSLHGTSFNFLKTVNVSGPEDSYTVSMTAWDTHTAMAIEAFNVETTKDSVQFDAIKISSQDALSVTTEKLVDKYSFEFDYGKLGIESGGNTRIYYIESDGPLDYIRDSIYPAHFVDYKNKKWIDFGGIGYIPKVTKISPNRWQITFDNVKEGTLKFNSIGGLNSGFYQYTYYLSKPTIVWITSPNIMISDSNIVTVQLNVSGLYKNTTRFDLYNGTYVIINSSIESHQGSSDYIYSTTFSSLNKSTYYINATHYDINGEAFKIYGLLLQSLSLTECSLSGWPTLNFTFLDEVYGQRVTAKGSGTFSYRSFSTSFTNVNNLEICINPNYANLTSDYTISYYNDFYPVRDYTRTSQTMSNSTQYINLYMLNTSSGNTFAIKVIDGVGSAVLGATGTLYDSNNNIISIGTTDSAGLATFFLMQGKTYTMVVSKSGYVPSTATITGNLFSPYTIVLGGGESSANFGPEFGVLYSFYPKVTIYNGTPYNFSTILTSEYYPISSCTFNILDNISNVLSTQNIFFNSTLCNGTMQYNTVNYPKLSLQIIAIINDTGRNYSFSYIISNSELGKVGSLSRFIKDFNKIKGGGFDDFTKGLLAVIILLAFMTQAAMVTIGEYDVEKNILLFIVLMWALSIMGFFTVSTNYSYTTDHYIIALLITLLGGGFILQRHV